MTISELMECLQTAKDRHGDMDVYVDIQKEETCSECGEPEFHTIDGYPHRTHVGEVDGSLCFWLYSEYGSKKPKRG